MVSSTNKMLDSFGVELEPPIGPITMPKQIRINQEIREAKPNARAGGGSDPAVAENPARSGPGAGRSAFRYDLIIASQCFYGKGNCRAAKGIQGNFSAHLLILARAAVRRFAAAACNGAGVD